VTVSLPPALDNFVSSQVKSGEFEDASAVVTEAVRLLRNAREIRAMDEMRAAFAPVDSSSGKRQPTAHDCSIINSLIKTHRAGKRSQ
jgi:putative addiction module CopG family antidote